MCSALHSRRSWWSRQQSLEVREANDAVRHDETTKQGHKHLEVLNNSLFALAAIFPDVQHEVLREMLGTFPEESRLQVIIETLLKNKDAWVKDRWRVTEVAPVEAERSRHVIEAKERFRSQQYKDAVKQACYQEFKGLSHSTIKAVLAETNHFYLDARRCLAGIAAKSWRYSLTSWFAGKKAMQSDDSPLIRWIRMDDGVLEPMLIPTVCYELNDELEKLVLAPLRAQNRREQLAKDVHLAEQLHELEAEEKGAVQECAVCYTTSSLELSVHCAAGNHFVCYSCVGRTMSEALYGQGWAKSIDNGRWTLACIGLGDCNSYIPRPLLRLALCSTEKNSTLWAEFEARAVSESTSHLDEPKVQCPSCLYTEVDAPWSTDRSLPNPLLLAISYLFWLIGLILPVVVRIIGSLLTIPERRLNRIQTRLRRKLTNFRRGYFPSTVHRPATTEQPHPAVPPFGRKFICRNPSCALISCLACTQPWTDPHICHNATTSSSPDAIRTSLESFNHFLASRATASITRICPHCHISFLKSSGCNKLTCPCGYSMCYLCRTSLEKVGYSHFCPHFRPVPGERCTECERCELYGEEDEGVVVGRAREEAVREWRGKVGSLPIGVGEDGVAIVEGPKGKGRRRTAWFGA